MIAKRCGGGDIRRVEGTTSTEMEQNLDMLAGVDAWQVCSARGVMRGIASRVQDLDYDTFTIRYKRDSGAETEYAKRQRAIHDIDGGWLLPHLTVQAYYHHGYEKFRCCAAVRTKELYGYIEKWLPRFEEFGESDALNTMHTKETGPDGALFIVVPFLWLMLAGVKVKVWPDGPDGYTPRDPTGR